MLLLKVCFHLAFISSLMIIKNQSAYLIRTYFAADIYIYKFTHLKPKLFTVKSQFVCVYV